MTNKTITLSRELVERAVMRPGKESLAVNNADIIARGRAQAEMRAALAEPVPPAGGEPEVRAAFDAWFILDRALDPQTDTTLIDGPFEPWRAWKACADQYRAHVTRLQAEVGRLASYSPTPENTNRLPEGIRQYVSSLQTLCDPSGIVAENTLLRDQTKQLDAMIGRLKSELTKARELLDVETQSRIDWSERAAVWVNKHEAVKEALTGAVVLMTEFCARVDAGEARSKRTYAKFKDFLSNQSAPADKDD